MNEQEEMEKLLKIWESASDYLLGIRAPEFADINGGIDHLRESLSIAVKEYEESGDAE